MLKILNIQNIRKKLRECAGETLVETLAAVLIIGIVSGGFAALIMESTKLNQEATTQYDALYRDVSAIEIHDKKKDEEPETGTISVIVEGESESVTVGVTYYSNESGNLYSYEVATTEASSTASSE